jgi:hypothetical protein
LAKTNQPPTQEDLAELSRLSNRLRTLKNLNKSERAELMIPIEESRREITAKLHIKYGIEAEAIERQIRSLKHKFQIKQKRYVENFNGTYGYL